MLNLIKRMCHQVCKVISTVQNLLKPLSHSRTHEGWLSQVRKLQCDRIIQWISNRPGQGSGLQIPKPRPQHYFCSSQALDMFQNQHRFPDTNPNSLDLAPQMIFPDTKACEHVYFLLGPFMHGKTLCAPYTELNSPMCPPVYQCLLI